MPGFPIQMPRFESRLPDGFQSVIAFNFLPLGKRTSFEHPLNDELRPVWPINLVEINVPEQRSAKVWLTV